MAFFGSQLIFYFILGTFFFLLPISFISAEFASRFPEEGGIFHWIRRSFGVKAAVFAIWLQWINTMVWYPTMLLFTAATAAHAIAPTLADKPLFLLFFALICLWGLTILNFFGVYFSAKLNVWCSCLGTFVPMGLLIGCGIVWIFLGCPCSIAFSPKTFFPSFDFLQNGNGLITVIASFLGMELAGVHVGDICSPRKNFPRAIACAAAILLAFLILGALSVAVVIPREEIRFVDGVMQTFSLFLTHLHMPYCIPLLAGFIAIGSAGGSVNWLIGPAKGLLQMAEYGFLPFVLLKKNRHEVATRILLVQALLISFLCLAIQLIPNMNLLYWFFLSLSTGLYLFMYAILFLAALKLGRPVDNSLVYKIPRGIRTFSCLLGLIGCFITIFFTFIPPQGIGCGVYVLSIALGFVCMLLPVLWLYRKKTRIYTQIT